MCVDPLPKDGQPRVRVRLGPTAASSTSRAAATTDSSASEKAHDALQACWWRPVPATRAARATASAAASAESERNLLQAVQQHGSL